VSSRSAEDGARSALTTAAAEWLARITDPDATEQDFRAWQEWLAQDSAHVSAYEEMERIWALTAHLPAAPSMRPVHELTLATVEEIPAPKAARDVSRKPRTMWQRVVVASAAAVAAIAIITATIVMRNADSNVFETATAEQRSLRLTDGSQVVLGAETRVKVNMGDKRRSLEMNHGVAYFKVAHDTTRPFVVSGGGYAIEAVGTAFTVDTKPNRVVVTVTEGVVRVARQVGRSSGEGTGPVLVRAGERIALDGVRPQCTAIDDAPGAALGWRDGRLEYMQEELRFVIADVNRYSARKIVFASPDIGRLEFTGTLFLEHIDEWLDTLQGSFPLTVSADGSQRIVLQATEQDALREALSSYDAEPTAAMRGDGC
jgi:transmembrane sensor